MRETFIIEDLLNILIRLETLGNENYTRLSKGAEDKRNRELFGILANQELRHKEIYEDFKSRLTDSEAADSEYLEYARILIEQQMPVLRNMEIPESFEEGLKLAIELEKETIFFLHEIRGLLSVEQARRVDPLLAEERKHLQYLLTYTPLGE